MSSKRALVTGGAGFIGSHVVDALLDAGFGVTVVDNLSSGRRTNLPAAAGLRVADVRDRALREVFQAEKPDVVFHLAAQVSVGASVASPVEDAETNIIGLVNVVEAAIRAGARRVVFSSSAAVYGEPETLPLTETAVTRPESPYGLSKLTGERYLELLGRRHGLEYVILRYANVYGPRQSAEGEAGVIAIFASGLAQGRPVAIFGDGRQTRDFIFVRDVAAATVLAGISPDAVGRVINVSSGVRADILSVYRVIAELSGGPTNPVFGPDRPGDVRDSLLDNSRARAFLGWTPEIALNAGLRETVEFLQRTPWDTGNA